MENKRTQIIINNANFSEMRRIEVAINKEFLSSEYSIKPQEKCIIINDKENVEAIVNIIKSVNEKYSVQISDVVEKYRYVFFLENLDCANCAAKVERICKRKIACEFVVVDFATLKIIIETTKKYDIFDIRMLIQECAEMVDPNIEVKERLEKKEEKVTHAHKTKFILFIIGVAIFLVFGITKDILKFIFDIDNIWLYVFIYAGYIPAYLLISYDVLYGAFKNIKNKRFFDELFLISLATITAFIIKLYDEAFLLMLFYQIGEMIQNRIIDVSRKNVKELVGETVEKVVVDVDGAKQEINPDGVMLGDIIYISAGNKITFDGIVSEGQAILDCKSLTGESVPVPVKSGDKILSGCVCIEGNIKLKVTKSYDESTEKIIFKMVEDANLKKANAENVIAKLARYYTPIVCSIAILLAIFLPLISPTYKLQWIDGYKESIRTAMIFLVASCPCALVISIPLAYFGSIGNASKKGILVKGSCYLESLSKIGAVVFDKTGTLTKGSFTVSKIISYSKYTEEEILYYAAHVESTSNHVIAKSVVRFYDKSIDDSIVVPEVTPNPNGVIAKILDKEVSVGNRIFLDSLKIKSPEVIENDRNLYVVIDKKVVGYLVIEDEVREESKKLVEDLKKLGINRIVMLTGDSFNIAEKVSKQLGINEFYYNMLPIVKVNKSKEIKEECPKQNVVFVGDGINDALVISESDIGIAVSGIDNAAITQIADVVLVNEDLNKVHTLIKIARKTKLIIYENIIFTLLVKFTVMVLATINYNYVYNTIMVYLGIFADVGISIIAVLNTLRLLKRSQK